MPGQSQPLTAKAAVVARRELVPGRLFALELLAPRLCAATRPGHLIIVQATERSRRLSLPVADLSGAASGRLGVVLADDLPGAAALLELPVGAAPAAVLGPVGQPSRLDIWDSVLLLGEGVAAFGLVPIARALREQGTRVRCMLGGEPDMAGALDRLISCDPPKIVAPDQAAQMAVLLEGEVRRVKPDMILAAGPHHLLWVVRQVAEATRVAARVRLNVDMLDGEGMCGGCRARVGGRLKLCCLEGVEFDAAAVDFDHLARREHAVRAAGA